ncbi:MAG: M24 family metallopeptidase [Desulfovibrio sp.]|uniref:M24 family metallopeptidase n=1 Tax=Desulfovibrio sp. 7SRBS1 TaxID=3378064 RepID=UPI003B3EC2B9
MDMSVCTRRREKLRRKLREENLDALLVSHAANRFYLSGFELHDPQCNESAGMLLITASGDDWLLTDSRYWDAAKRLWPENFIHLYSMPKGKDINDFLRDKMSGVLGFEETGLCYATWHQIGKGLELKPTNGLVEEQRLYKDEVEIAAMRRACALNHACCEALPEILQPGKTEREVAWEIEQFYRNNGASGLSFSTIVGVGPNAALPHAIPGDTKVRENDLVLVDMGCRLDEYCSDQTRTLWVGDTPSGRFSTTLEIVQEAQRAAIDILRPGLTVSEAYRAANAVFEKHGRAEYFTHALGHGIGLETHEPPSLGPTRQFVLKPGMIITIEPGLYYPEWGGIRWEHMLLITEDGAETL